MNGCVIKGTPIAVDFWYPIKAPEVRLFFLTHLHQDHIQGLSGSWMLPIYTSPINALLLEHKFDIDKKIIRELEVGETYLLPLDREGDLAVSVTPLDANHVPGAVMFLFQGYFGNILYCGDMRWYPELVEHPVLRSLVQASELDVLYMDNTFSAPFCKFPSREEAKRQLFDIIDSYPDHTIKIGVRDLGREDLLEAIARRYQERILVNQNKFKILELLQYSDAFTNDSSQSRIHAIPMSQIQVRSHKKWNEESPTVSIIPTALFVGWPYGPYSSQTKIGLFTVPYSDHSSYSELMEMVESLRPRSIIPIVEHWSKSGWWADPNAPDQSQKFDMSAYDHLLTYPPPDPFMVPEAVTKIMAQGGPLLTPMQPQRFSRCRGLAPRPKRAPVVKGVVFTPLRSTESPAPSGSMTLDISFRTDTSCSIKQSEIDLSNRDADIAQVFIEAHKTSLSRKMPSVKKHKQNSCNNEVDSRYLSSLRHRIINRTKALALSHYDSIDSITSGSELIVKAKAVCQSLSYVDKLFS